MHVRTIVLRDQRGNLACQLALCVVHSSRGVACEAFVGCFDEAQRCRSLHDPDPVSVGRRTKKHPSLERLKTRQDMSANELLLNQYVQRLNETTNTIVPDTVKDIIER